MREGNAHFFVFGQARTIVGVGELPAAATIGQIAFRRDGQGTQGLARSVDIKVTLSTGDLRILPTDLQNLHGSDKATVVDRTQVRVPNWSTSAGAPAPFDFALKFSKPFAYKSGALIWQLDYGKATSFVQMRTDRQIAGSRFVNATRVGTGCAGSEHTMRLENSGSGMRSSAMRIRISGSKGLPNAPTWICLDFQASRVSVPGLCSRLYAVPTVFAPTFPLDATGSLPDVYLGFPYVKALEDQTIVTQLASLDTKQPGIPLRMSEGMQAKMPSNVQTSAVDAAYMWFNPVVTTRGSFFFGGSILAEFRP